MRLTTGSRDIGLSVACWVPRELAADDVLTPYGQLRPAMARQSRGLAEAVQLVDPVTGARSVSWRRAVVRVPCGECPGCQVDWSRAWTVRALAEFLEGHGGYPEHRGRDCWFGTFTFDDAHVPSVEVNGARRMTLDREVWTQFEKRLREWSRWWYPEARLRRLAVGEYGSLRLRPHFHALLFDLPIEDAEPDPGSPGGRFPLFVSKSLSRLWGHGNVWLGRVSRASSAYVTAYLAKAARWPFGVVEPFRLMSTGCGRTAKGSGSLGGFGSAYFDRYWSSMYSASAGEHRGMMVTGEPGDVRWLPAPRYFHARLREQHFDAWLDFERARLARAKEIREALTVNQRQARVALLWENLTRKTRDGLFAGPSGPVLPVQYRDGRVERVPVVQRFDEFAVVGPYGPEVGFGLSDYLDEVARVGATEAREVPLQVGRTYAVLDSEGHRARLEFLEGTVRPNDGHLVVGSVVGLDDLVVPGSDEEAPREVPALPGDVVREAGFAEVRREHG